MTKNEAILLIKEMYFSDTYLEGFGYTGPSTLLEHEKEFDFDALINYFESLDIPYEVLKAFVSGDIEFDLINGEHSGDDFDYLVIYKNKDGSFGMYAWTEVCGITYDIKDYGITWTERHETEEEIKEREERYREWKADREGFYKEWETTCSGLLNKALPDFITAESKDVKPMNSLYDQYVEALTKDAADNNTVVIDKDIKEEK